jgi:hypothetical protein
MRGRNVRILLPSCALLSKSLPADYGRVAALLRVTSNDG